MKIVSWNANGRFRDKYPEILKLEADIYVIQECENPATCKDPVYRDLFSNAIWAGELGYKGMMVYSPKSELDIRRLDWPGQEKRVFIPVRINGSFNLVAAWACAPYCEELYDWIEAVSDYLNRDTIILGDLNSNVVFDAKHVKKSGKSFAKCLTLLKDHGIEDIWHHYKKEQQGKESCPTFYLYRHLDKPFHIDHCLADPCLVSAITIHARWQWLSLSDHLPVEILVNIAHPTDF